MSTTNYRKSASSNNLLSKHSADLPSKKSTQNLISRKRGPAIITDQNKIDAESKRTTLDGGKKRMFGDVLTKNKMEAKRMKTGAFRDVSNASKQVAVIKPLPQTAYVKDDLYKPKPASYPKGKALINRRHSIGTLDLDKLSDAINYVTGTLPEGVEDIDSGADVYSCKDYASDVVNYVRNLEDKWKMPTNYLEKCPVNSSSRALLMDWLIQVQNHLQMDQETLHLTVAMIDHFMSRRTIPLGKIQLVGITCLLIAAKYIERFAPSIEKLIHLTDSSYAFHDVIKMELMILKVLEFALYIPTPIVFMDRGLKAVVCKGSKLEILTQYLLDLAIPDFKILIFAPSLRGAGAIYLAKRILETEGQNTDQSSRAVVAHTVSDKSLAYYVGHNIKEIVLCARRYARLLCRAEADKHQGANSKYEHKSLGGVSKWSVLKNNNYVYQLAISM